MKKILIILVAQFFTLQQGKAALVASFDGIITGFTSQSPLSGVAVGDPFSFQVYYDLTPTSSSNNGTFVNNVYVPSTNSAYWWFGEGYSMSASFGAYSITTVDNSTFDIRNSLTQRGFAIYNAFSFTSGNYSTGGGTGSLSVGLFSTLPTGHTFPDSSLEAVVDYPIADFNQNAFRALGIFNGVSGDIQGQVTSYHIAIVPEPSLVALIFIGVFGASFRRLRIK